MSDGDERGTSERPSEPSNSVSEETDTSTPSAPALRIITPHTTPEEVAALVAVLAGLGGAGEAAPEPRRTWASVGRRIGAVDVPGPEGWRTSALPR